MHATAATNSARCLTATIEELWRNPSQFEGKRVCVSGLLGRMVPYGEDRPDLYATREEAETRHSQRYVTIGVPMTIASQEALSRHSVQSLRVQGVFEFDPRCWPAPGQSSAEYSCFPFRPMRIANAELTFCDARLCGHAGRSDTACNVTSLDDVFREPQRYFGERFCGEALAGSEDRIQRRPAREVTAPNAETMPPARRSSSARRSSHSAANAWFPLPLASRRGRACPRRKEPCARETRTRRPFCPQTGSDCATILQWLR